jgi:hypothetical protein
VPRPVLIAVLVLLVLLLAVGKWVFDGMAVCLRVITLEPVSRRPE